MISYVSYGCYCIVSTLAQIILLSFQGILMAQSYGPFPGVEHLLDAQWHCKTCVTVACCGSASTNVCVSHMYTSISKICAKIGKSEVWAIHERFGRGLVEVLGR